MINPAALSRKNEEEGVIRQLVKKRLLLPPKATLPCKLQGKGRHHHAPSKITIVSRAPAAGQKRHSRHRGNGQNTDKNQGFRQIRALENLSSALDGSSGCVRQGPAAEGLKMNFGKQEDGPAEMLRQRPARALTQEEARVTAARHASTRCT